jgi:antibiotic biosynthesis monooxygenase (ABM) superfamily enzyme
MPEQSPDPSQNTQAFQAWVDRGGQPVEQPAKPKVAPLVIGIVVVVVILAALGWLAFG